MWTVRTTPHVLDHVISRQDLLPPILSSHYRYVPTEKAKLNRSHFTLPIASNKIVRKQKRDRQANQIHNLGRHSNLPLPLNLPSTSAPKAPIPHPRNTRPCTPAFPLEANKPGFESWHIAEG